MGLIDSDLDHLKEEFLSFHFLVKGYGSLIKHLRKTDYLLWALRSDPIMYYTIKYFH